MKIGIERATHFLQEDVLLNVVDDVPPTAANYTDDMRITIAGFSFLSNEYFVRQTPKLLAAISDHAQLRQRFVEMEKDEGIVFARKMVCRWLSKTSHFLSCLVH
jgi:hypothetical protein